MCFTRHNSPDPSPGSCNIYHIMSIRRCRRRRDPCTRDPRRTSYVLRATLATSYGSWGRVTQSLQPAGGPAPPVFVRLVGVSQFAHQPSITAHALRHRRSSRAMPPQSSARGAECAPSGLTFTFRPPNSAPSNCAMHAEASAASFIRTVAWPLGRPSYANEEKNVGSALATGIN